jgi:hypothetical protein
MKLKRHFWLTNTILIAAITGILVFGEFELYILVYIAAFLVLLARTFLPKGQKRVKLWLIIAFGFVLACQIVLATQLLSSPNPGGGRIRTEPFPANWAPRIICTIVIAVPLVVSRYVVVGKYAQLYLPSIREVGSVGFGELKDVAGKARLIAKKAGRTKKNLTAGNFREIINDFPRHSSFNYINEGSLTDDYFEKAGETLDDPRLYIVISRTGSAASNIISVITNKNYNHVSLSFDRELETTVSYNGGNNVYPPGMNPEMLADFTRRGNASILVYSLKCTHEQKAQVLSLIRNINESGSAYNIFGLVLKSSYRPNIMFCSQFVYRMLELTGLVYFKKADGWVEPTDFIELDYRRALSFEYEVGL